MKKLIIVSAVIFFTSARINAQDNETLAKNDIQNDNYDPSAIIINKPKTGRNA